MPPKFLATPENDKITDRCYDLESQWRTCLEASMARHGAVVRKECAKEQGGYLDCLNAASVYTRHRAPEATEDRHTIWGVPGRGS